MGYGRAVTPEGSGALLGSWPSESLVRLVERRWPTALVVSAVRSRTEDWTRMQRIERMQEQLQQRTATATANAKRTEGTTAFSWGVRHVESLVAHPQEGVCELDRWLVRHDGRSVVAVLQLPQHPPNPPHPRHSSFLDLSAETTSAVPGRPPASPRNSRSRRGVSRSSVRGSGSHHALYRSPNPRAHSRSFPWTASRAVSIPSPASTA